MSRSQGAAQVIRGSEREAPRGVAPALTGHLGLCPPHHRLFGALPQTPPVIWGFAPNPTKGTFEKVPLETLKTFQNFLKSFDATSERKIPMAKNIFECAMKTGGYAGKILSKYTREWAVTAFQKNPGITGHFTGASERLPAPGADERHLMVWYNEFAGKLLTGMAINYAADPSDELLSEGNSLADSLAEVQCPDGYLGIFDEDRKFGADGENWDVWGHYHSAVGLYYWHKVTGNEKAMETATKALECVWNHFVGEGRTFDSASNQTMNLAVSHAFALFYKETGEKKYLDAAIQIVDDEWPLSGDWKNSVLSGKEYFESPLPRWEALHTIMTLAPLYEITGKKEYFDALEKIWKSLQKTDRHNTGGFSSGEQVQGTPFATGAIETCCTIAWMALTTEYLRVSKNSVAADELELSFFNGMLGAVMPDGRQVTYNTPMRNDRENYSCQVDIGFQMNRFSPDFNCCQANSLRGLYEITRSAVVTDETSLTVNYYGESEIKAKTPSGSDIVLTQTTSYPADRIIKITLSETANEIFDIRLRIPCWSKNTTVSVNGQKAVGVNPGEYFSVSREWKKGDIIEIILDMTPHFWAGKEDFTGTVSVYRGPILLTLDNVVENDITLPFTADDLSSMKVTDVSADGVHDLKFEITSKDGAKTELFDFASCGKTSGYTSWLRFEDSDSIKLTTPAVFPDWCGEASE